MIAKTFPLWVSQTGGWDSVPQPVATAKWIMPAVTDMLAPVTIWSFSTAVGRCPNCDSSAIPAAMMTVAVRCMKFGSTDLVRSVPVSDGEVISGTSQSMMCTNAPKNPETTDAISIFVAFCLKDMVLLLFVEFLQVLRF